ncbi:MAG: hypothetical protein ACLP05_01975 [Candidatus Kryptoniota bacterium]
MEKIKVVNSGSFGIVWVIGWLFTLGLLKLTFWSAVLAILIWPYYIGLTLSVLIK